MTTSAANPYHLKTCKLCGRRYASWGAHMEECRGPTKPAPDYNPRVDHPERYMSDDVWQIDA